MVYSFPICSPCFSPRFFLFPLCLFHIRSLPMFSICSSIILRLFFICFQFVHRLFSTFLMFVFHFSFILRPFFISSSFVPHLFFFICSPFIFHLFSISSPFISRILLLSFPPSSSPVCSRFFREAKYGSRMVKAQYHFVARSIFRSKFPRSRRNGCQGETQSFPGMTPHVILRSEIREL